MRITDRTKDVIKSGGEWISSIDLENVAAGCSGVKIAAVVGIPHPKWEERPLLIVEPHDGILPDEKEILSTLSAEFAKRSEEHTSELQSLMRISFAAFCLKKKKQKHI